MRPVTHVQIAESSGLPIGRVRWLAGKLDWTGCDLPTVMAWMRACHFNPSRQFREREFLRRSVLQAGCPMPHLKKLPPGEFKVAKRMLALIVKK